MITKQIDTCLRSNPVPLSFLISTANSFHCDIQIQCDENRIDVKNYDDMLRRLRPRQTFLLFFFSGTDEQAAGRKFEQIFQR